MIENRQVSRVFATRVCNFPAIQFDTQLLAPNINDALPRCLHQNFTSTWNPLSSKNQNHSVKLLLNKLKATNQRNVTKCFQNFSRLGTWTSSYFFSMFSLTLGTKVTRIHCTSSGCLNTVLEFIKCIKRTFKVDDSKLETSEEQRLDWHDNSVRCWVLAAKRCRSFCWSSAAVTELKRNLKVHEGLVFLSSNADSNSSNKLIYFSNCSCWNGVWRNRVIWLQTCFKEAAFHMLGNGFQQIENSFWRVTRQNLKIQLIFAGEK